jgi:hypothetical protein
MCFFFKSAGECQNFHEFRGYTPKLQIFSIKKPHHQIFQKDQFLSFFGVFLRLLISTMIGNPKLDTSWPSSGTPIVANLHDFTY